MKSMLIAIISIAISLVGLSFVIAQVFIEPPNIILGGYIYLFVTLMILCIFLGSKEFTNKITKVILVLFLVQFSVYAIVLSLIVLYQSPTNTVEPFASLLFMLSMLAGALAPNIYANSIVQINWKSISLFMFTAVVMLSSITHAMILMFNAPDYKIYPLFASIEMVASATYLYIFSRKHANMNNIFLKTVLIFYIFIFLFWSVKITIISLSIYYTNRFGYIPTILFFLGPLILSVRLYIIWNHKNDIENK